MNTNLKIPILLLLFVLFIINHAQIPTPEPEETTTTDIPSTEPSSFHESETSSSSTLNLDNNNETSFDETSTDNYHNERYDIPDNTPVEDLPASDDNNTIIEGDDVLPINNPTLMPDNSILIYENSPQRLNMSKDMNKTFTFIVINPIATRKIALLVSPIEKRKVPGTVSIFMTFQNYTPNPKNHDIVCQKVLMAFSSPCLISLPHYEENEAIPATKLKMMTVCDTDSCDLSLRVMHEAEIFLQAEKKQLYSFDREEGELFSFYVPQQFSRIIFNVNFKNLAENLYEYKLNEPEEVLYFTSGEPTMILNSFHAVAVFNSSDLKLCRSCNVSFYMTSKMGVIAELQYFLYTDGASPIKLNKGYYDYTIGKTPFIYLIELEDSQLPSELSTEKIFFTLNSLTGSEKTLYVNGDNNPLVLESFNWNSTQKQYYEEEDVIVTQADIQNSKLSGKKFFLAVKSNGPGLYKFKVRISTVPYVKLSYGVTESSVVAFMGTDYYELELWKTDSQEDKVEVKLINEKGNVDLYGRLCKFDQGCTLIRDEEIKAKVNIDFFSESEGNDVIKLEPKCPNDSPYCYIILAVRGHSMTNMMNKYSITVNKGNGIVNLLENKNHESHVESGKLSNYKLIIDDMHNEIDKITIKISADLTIGVTKNHFCPNLDDEKCKIKYGDTRHPVVYTQSVDGSMDGIFYIVVLGTKSTNFFILPQVRRKNKAKPSIRLSEGKIYRDSLSLNSPYEYFTFHLNIETITHLDINLQADRNELQMLVCDDGSSPNPDHYSWESSTNFLRITDEFDQQAGSYEKIYIVRINPKNPELLNNLNKTIEFGIVYSTDLTMKTLEKNQVFYDSVKEKLYRFYVIFADNLEEQLSFTTHVINPSHLSNSLRMYVSPSPFPSYFSFNEKTITDKNLDKLIVSKEKLNDICKDKQHHCPIYLTIENINQENEITFSVMAEIVDFTVQIRQGYEQKFVVTETDFRAYFIPTHKDQEIDIFAYTMKENFELFVNVIDGKTNFVNSPAFSRYFDDKQGATYKSHFDNRHSLNIKNSSFEKCWPDCVVLIAMNFKLEANHDRNRGFTVYLLISDDLIEFSEGKPLIFSLDSSKVKYFSYDLMDIYKSFSDNASIIVSMTPFYGTALIYLQVSLNENNLRPSHKQYEFISYSDHIELSRSQLLKDLYLKDAKSLHSLKLLICVYAESEGKFLLNIISTKNVIPNIYSGIPHDVLLKGGMKQTLQYFNSNNEVLRLIFNREAGLGSLIITPCNPQVEAENTLDKCLEKATQKNNSYYSIMTGSMSSYIRLSEREHSDFCRYCIYIVILRAVSDLKGSLLVSHPSTVISLLEGVKSFDHLETDEKSIYTFYMLDTKYFEIIVSVFSGKPEVCFSYTYIKDSSNKSVCDFYQQKRSDYGHISMKISPETVIFDENEDKLLSHIYSYFIIVTSPVKTEYSITFITENSQLLQSGVISFDSLEPKTMKKYIHHFYDLESSPLLTVSCQENCQMKDLGILNKYRPKGAFENKEERLIHMNIDPQFTTNTTVSYKLPLIKASFEFDITNLADHVLNYSILVHSRDITVIPLDYNYQGVIEAKRSEYYEVYIPKTGYLALEFMDCYGEMEILVSRDYEKVVQNQFDEEFKPLKDQTFIHLLKVNKGMIYFTINNKLNSSVENAAFEFNLHFYENYLEIAQTRLSGNTINYKYDNELSQITFSIQPISCADCTEAELRASKITYIAMVAENQTVLNIAGKCGITQMSGSKLDLKDVQIQSENLMSVQLVESHSAGLIELSVPIKIRRQQIYYGTVKAVIDYLGEKKIVNMYYPTIEIMITKNVVEDKTLSIIAVIVSVIVFIGCCLFGAHFYGKYKKIEKKLLYEVEDPKNMTQVSGVNLYEPQNVSSIEMENKAYQGLNES